MEGLDIDGGQDEMTLDQAQQIIQQQKERIRSLLGIEDRFKRLQKEYDRLRNEMAFSKPNQEARGGDGGLQEIRKLRELIQEKESRLQYLEEANNRLVFRIRNLHTELSNKDKRISEQNQEIEFLKQNLNKPTQILVSEIQQKDVIIENLRKKLQQVHSRTINISEVSIQFGSSSYGHIPSSLNSQSYSSISMQPTSGSSSRSRRNNNRLRNREMVKNETDIMNKWNDTVQAYDGKDSLFFIRLKQYVILVITRLSMLEKDFCNECESIYSQKCMTCHTPFSCWKKPRACSICLNLFCKDCSPHCISLDNQGKEVRVCNVCESIYRFVFNNEVTQ